MTSTEKQFLREWVIIFTVLEVCLEVCMLTPTRVVIDAAMTYRREKLGLATLKPEQEMAISNFPLGKDKITGNQCFLNHCEESDDLGSQGSLLQIKQGCSAIDQSTHATTNTCKQTNSYLEFFLHKT